jgi:hypothetical protein
LRGRLMARPVVSPKRIRGWPIDSSVLYLLLMIPLLLIMLVAAAPVVAVAACFGGGYRENAREGFRCVVDLWARVARRA